MPIAIIDYGAGNLRSVQKALEKLGFQADITDNRSKVQNANGIILPGVGAFDPAMEELQKKDLIGTILEEIKKGKPFLGLCLGMQLLFETSQEGKQKGLGLFKGEVKRFSPTGPRPPATGYLKIPHMGWNNIKTSKDSPILKDVPDSSKMYFVHSYYCDPSDAADILTTTDYGVNFASSISKGNIFALQFHPEKSSATGLQILKNFGGLCK